MPSTHSNTRKDACTPEMLFAAAVEATRVWQARHMYTADCWHHTSQVSERLKEQVGTQSSHACLPLGNAAFGKTMYCSSSRLVRISVTCAVCGVPDAALSATQSLCVFLPALASTSENTLLLQAAGVFMAAFQ